MKHLFSVRGTCLLVFVTGVLVSVGAVGHHSPAAFDQTSEVDIEGTITDLSWSNPHITMTLEVVGPDGKRHLQEVEAASVSEERAAGVHKEMLPVGAQVVVRAHPSRRGPGARVNGLAITMSDGSRLPLHPTAGFDIAPEVRDHAASLAGRWAPTGHAFTETSNAIMTQWPFQDAARASLADALSRPGSSLGICADLPPPALSIFPELREIEIGETTIIMRFEDEGTNLERVIRMNEKEHPPDVKPSLLGHSIGWWEGETLVVDTTAFTPDPNGVFGWVPSGPDKHLVERFALAANRRQLRYEVTLEDSESLTGPASVSMLWDYRPDLQPSGVDCDPNMAERLLHDE
jgi:hypothetical protein